MEHETVSKRSVFFVGANKKPEKQKRKLMVGRLNFPFQMVPFQGTFVNFRGGILKRNPKKDGEKHQAEASIEGISGEYTNVYTFD